MYVYVDSFISHTCKHYASRIFNLNLRRSKFIKEKKVKLKFQIELKIKKNKK